MLLTLTETMCIHSAEITEWRIWSLSLQVSDLLETRWFVHSRNAFLTILKAKTPEDRYWPIQSCKSLAFWLAMETASI